MGKLLLTPRIGAKISWTPTWDRKKKEEDSIAAKKISYPGLIFTIMDTRNGKDLTPNFKKLFQK